MFSIKIFLKLFIFAILSFDYVASHGRLLEPAARSSAWRKDPTFPAYYNDMEMYCGGTGVQWNQNGGKCGICGENWASQKQFEKGGIYYTGRKVRTYSRGDTIDVHVELTANHLGWFEFRLCNVDGMSSDATQECLDKILLKDTNGNTRFPIAMGIRDYYTKLVLPSYMACNHCVFQWKYNTGNSYGKNETTGQQCLGCGTAVEQFYGCSDIQIKDGTYIPPSTTTIVTTTTVPRTTTTSTTTITTTVTTMTTTRLPVTLTWPWTTPTPSQSSSSITLTWPSIPTKTTSIISAITSGISTTSVVDKPVTSKDPCTKGDGIFADIKTNCSRYYICSYSGTPFESKKYFNCLPSLKFDDRLKICNFEDTVDCGN